MTFNLHPYQEKLVRRARDSYKQGYKFPLIVSPCGSGKSVVISEIARLTTMNSKRVLFLVHRRELIDQIKETFAKNNVALELVEFGMVQTIVRRLDKTIKPDLIITDESHHAKAGSYKKIYEYFDGVPKLGFTATPIRLNGDGLGDVNDIMIEEVDVQYLINNQFLTPFRYFAPNLIDTDVLSTRMNEFTTASIDKTISKKIYGDCVEHYRKLADGEKAIAYCHSIESSINTAQAFNDAGIPAAHIDGKTPKPIRDEIIQKFRDGAIQVLSNCEIIGEGFDVPDCSTVILLRPTQSLSLYIQMAMRGMRYRPNKTSIIIDHVANYKLHGLPNTPREWSLESKKKKKQNSIFAKQCPDCQYVMPSAYTICPECGHEWETEKEKVDYEVDKSAELIEIDTSIQLDLDRPEDCTTMKELHELAKRRGYKAGWAFHQAKLLKITK